MLVFLCLCESFFVCFYVSVFFFVVFFCLREKEEAVSGAIEDAYHLRKGYG